jgi:hypothetical protein
MSVDTHNQPPTAVQDATAMLADARVRLGEAKQLVDSMHTNFKIAEVDSMRLIVQAHAAAEGKVLDLPEYDANTCVVSAPPNDQWICFPHDNLGLAAFVPAVQSMCALLDSEPFAAFAAKHPNQPLFQLRDEASRLSARLAERGAAFRSASGFVYWRQPFYMTVSAMCPGHYVAIPYPRDEQSRKTAEMLLHSEDYDELVSDTEGLQDYLALDALNQRLCSMSKWFTDTIFKTDGDSRKSSLLGGLFPMFAAVMHLQYKILDATELSPHRNACSKYDTHVRVFDKSYKTLTY